MGHLSEHEKEQDNGNCVKKHTREMVSSRLQSVNLAVQHVRNRRQRVPVSGMTMDKSADDAIDRQASRNRRVFVNIYVIVKIDEIVCEPAGSSLERRASCDVYFACYMGSCEFG